MKSMTCERCGSGEYVERNSQLICAYCRAIYEKAPVKPKTTIGLNDDIANLLEKCRKEPRRASRYASRILDIDPTNKEALKYL